MFLLYTSFVFRLCPSTVLYEIVLLNVFEKKFFLHFTSQCHGLTNMLFFRKDDQFDYHGLMNVVV